MESLEAISGYYSHLKLQSYIPTYRVLFFKMGYSEGSGCKDPRTGLQALHPIQKDGEGWDKGGALVGGPRAILRARHTIERRGNRQKTMSGLSVEFPLRAGR
jgi:hypothetical protein